MEDKLGFSSINCKSQKLVWQRGTIDDRKNGSYRLGYNSDARSETGISTKSWAQLFADDDNEGMEKMTLQDMQCMLRKAIERSPNKVDSVEPAAGNFSQSNSDSETFLSVDSHAPSEGPSVGLELLLEDSTSNSSDNMFLKGDPTGISSSNGLSRGFLQGNSADLLCGNKRSSTGSESRVETEVADDEWTLQKWQKLYHKQHVGRKRSRKSCKLQQEISESSAEVCSNSPSLALMCPCASILEVESYQDTEVIKDNCVTDSSDGKPQLRLASVKDPLLTSDIFALEDSSQASASFCSHATVRLDVEDESEIATSRVSMPGRLQNTRNGWSLKACDKIETTPLPKLALPQAKMVCKTNSGNAFGQFGGEMSNFNPDTVSAKVSGQRKQWEDITSNLSPDNASGSKQQGTAMQVTDGICKPKAVLRNEPGHLNASQLNSKGLPVFSASLNCIENFEIDEEQEPHQKPAKIPCKRKAISPMSQEFLLKASKLGEFGVDTERTGMKKLPLIFDDGWVDVPKGTLRAIERNGENQKAPQGSRCCAKEQAQVLEVLQSTDFLVASTEKCVVEPATMTSQHIPEHVPSKTQNLGKVTNTISPTGLPHLMPAKGILRSCCQGPCGCEECASLRSRAERASEFSQRQMQDIEGLAVKLMKDLSILRNIVEDRLIQSSVKHRSPGPILSIDQLKKATINASETEETAKKWLIRMARDCNRYCKIMRMQGRKLTFADESGGKLCHVKVFHSEPYLDSTTGLHERPLEANCGTSSTPNEPAVEVVCSVERTI